MTAVSRLDPATGGLESTSIRRTVAQKRRSAGRSTAPPQAVLAANLEHALLDPEAEHLAPPPDEPTSLREVEIASRLEMALIEIAPADALARAAKSEAPARDRDGDDPGAGMDQDAAEHRSPAAVFAALEAALESDLELASDPAVADEPASHEPADGTRGAALPAVRERSGIAHRQGKARLGRLGSRMVARINEAAARRRARRGEATATALPDTRALALAQPRAVTARLGALSRTSARLALEAPVRLWRSPGVLTAAVSVAGGGLIVLGVLAMAFESASDPTTGTTGTGTSGDAALASTAPTEKAEDSAPAAVVAIATPPEEAGAPAPLREAVSAADSPAEKPASRTVGGATGPNGGLTRSVAAGPTRGAVRPGDGRVVASAGGAPWRRRADIGTIDGGRHGLAPSTFARVAPHEVERSPSSPLAPPEPAQEASEPFAASEPSAAPSSAQADGEPELAGTPNTTVNPPLPEPRPVAAPRRSAGAPESPSPGPSHGTGTIVRAVNMRSGPGNGSPTVAVIPAGSNVSVVSCRHWCRIGYDGEQGYVYKTFLDH